jgi:hypothetical protein
MPAHALEFVTFDGGQIGIVMARHGDGTVELRVAKPREECEFWLQLRMRKHELILTDELKVISIEDAHPIRIEQVPQHGSLFLRRELIQGELRLCPGITAIPGEDGFRPNQVDAFKGPSAEGSDNEILEEMDAKVTAALTGKLG